MASFIVGLILKDKFDYSGHLDIILVVDGLVVAFYTAAILNSRNVHSRVFRIFCRLVITSLALYGPERALNECKLRMVRVYGYDAEPDPSGTKGFHFSGNLDCPADGHTAIRNGDSSLQTYHLLRRRCIVALTVFVLMEIELVSYWRSDEGLESPPHEDLAAPIDIEMGDAADQRDQNYIPRNRINGLRLLVLCFAFASFSMGLVLQEQLELGRDLTIIIVMDCFAIVVYLEAIHSSLKKTHRRGGRMLLRLVMTVLTLYGPARVLHGCSYRIERLYDLHPGVLFSGVIQCPEDTHYSRLESGVLSSYHLLRARSIVTLTLGVLVVAEMVAYMRSAEGRKLPQDVELTAPIDIGTGTTSSHQANNNWTSAATPVPMLANAPPAYSP
ncbi:hypothetical protein BGZ68_008671 [Mortierella alpina]|nr:hypothetical protein BGZ68_008671 [Mortierella alpina]